MNIQQAAEMGGLPPATIRCYERQGVLPRPPRQPNGYRNYTEEHVATLLLARGLRDLGLPLSEIGAILLVTHDGTCGELRTKLREALQEALATVDARIGELRVTKRRLATISDELQRMRPADRRRPRMTPCECVQIVSSERG